MNDLTAQQSAAPQPQNARAVLEMMAAAFSFATMSCIAHGLREQLAWPFVALVRIALTFLLVLLMARVSGAPLHFRGTKALWWRSLSGTTGLLCTFYAVTHLPVTDTVTIFATGPLWITAILAVIFKQRSPLRVWLFMLFALAGVYVMYRPAFNADALPLAVALFGSVAAAAAMVSISRCAELPPLSVVAHYSACATLICLAICALGLPQIRLQPDWNSANGPALLAMGFAGTLAQVLMTATYGRGSTTLVALVGISQIAFAALYDIIVWGYAFDFWKAAGVIMIAAAITMNIFTAAKTAQDQ